SALDYRQILQTIVDTVGHMLEVDVCLLRPFQDEKLADEGFIYQKSTQASLPDQQRSATENNDAFSPPLSKDNNKLATANQVSITPLPLLAQTVWEIDAVQVIHNVTGDDRIQSREKRAAAFKEANICSSLVVPLICQQELRAVLALHQCDQIRIWEEEEVE
ncbi:MAG: GAF domain-containing protein, partial [bacterium]